MKTLLVWLGGLALIVVLFWYLRGAFRRRPQYRLKNLPSPTAGSFVAALAALSDSFLSSGQVTDFWVEAEAIFAARLAAIRSARRSLEFETYIMTPGQRSDDLAIALCERAEAGVKIHLIADSYGAKSLSPAYWQRLEAFGIEVGFYNPPSWRHPLGGLRRNHRKLLIVDGDRLLIGGAGISDRWDGWEKINDTAPWRDYEVGLRGTVVGRVRGLFWQHWLDCQGAADLAGWEVEEQVASEDVLLITSGEDPSYRDSGIRSLFHLLIQGARARVWLASPYFLPDENLRESLVRARQRGIDVRILTMGKRCDKPFVRYAAQERYGDLLTSGVIIYEYQPSMLHAKLVLVDDDWVSFGSANFDPRSFFENEELNITSRDKTLVAAAASFISESFLWSETMSLKALRQRSWYQRLIGRLALLFYWQL